MAGNATPEERARKRTADWASVRWHVASYLIINGFLWFLDLLDGGLEWAVWVSIPWGVGLAFHIAAYLIEGRGIQDRKYEQFLAVEREREAHRQPS